MAKHVWMNLCLRSRTSFFLLPAYVFPSHACRSYISIPWYSKSHLVTFESRVEDAGQHAYASCKNSPTAGCLLRVRRRYSRRQKKGAVNVDVGVCWYFPLRPPLAGFLHWESTFSSFTWHFADGAWLCQTTHPLFSLKSEKYVHLAWTHASACMRFHSCNF